MPKSLRVNYVAPNGFVCSAGLMKDTAVYANWLRHMVESNPDTIFFFTVETTDVDF